MKLGKVKISHFLEGPKVLTPDYYLNIGKKTITHLIDRGINWNRLANLTDKLYQGGIFTRVFTTEGSKSFKYITASDMVKCHPLETAKNISKKFTPWIDEMTLRKQQILVSCAGSVGNVSIVNDSFSGCIGSQEIIRVECSSIPYGYLYAYLSTPIVYQYIQSMIYGAVVPRISPEEFGNLPILLPPQIKQQEIDDLIKTAIKLREEANKLLIEAQEFIEIKVAFKEKNRKYYVSKDELINSHQKRFEAQYYISEGSRINNHVRKMNYKLLKELCSPIFRPGIFKRHYVKSGIDFLGGSDIVKAIPRSDKKLSKAKTSYLESLKVKEDWILVTCGGTIGFSVLVNNYIAEKAASQHILRVIPTEIPTGYLFSYMSSKLGVKAIQSFTYGSVIPQIEPHHLELLPIPILDEISMLDIHEKIMKYKSNIAESISLELKATKLIEQQIELWQK